MRIEKLTITLMIFFFNATVWAQNQVILDSSFNSSGIVTFLATPQDAWDYSMLIQSDGKVVTAGRTQNDVLIVRYNVNGSLDNSFNLDGSALFPIGTGLSNTVRSYSVAIQPDKKLVFTAYNTSAGNVKIMRCDTSGSLDNSFGTGGIVSESLLGPNKVPIVVQPDGKIVVVGRGGLTNNIYVIRYNSDGSLDNTFGSGGSFQFTSAGTARNIALQSDGKIVITGIAINNDILIARVNANGTADVGFGTSGIVNVDIATGDDIGNSVKVQADGKIVVAGTAGSTANSFVVIRLNANGTLDNNFGIGGKITYQLGSGANGGNSLVIDTAGKFIIAGYAKNGNNDDFALIRLNSNGTIDNSFNSTGYVYTDINSGSDDGVTSIALQTNGKIVVAGYAGTSNDKLVVARYLTNGVNYSGNDSCLFTIYDTTHVTVFDTTHIVIRDTTYTTVFDTTNVIVYDTANITVLDTIHVTINDTIKIPIAVADTLIITVPTGLTPPNSTNFITVYPNPAHDHLIINNGNLANVAGYSIKITNILGQVVFNQIISQQQFYIDLSTFGGRGTYILYVLDASQVVKNSTKVVLQ